MGDYVLGLDEVDRSAVARVGVKGALLGELTRIEGVRVPEGFCVTTDAFARALRAAPAVAALVDALGDLPADDHDVIRAHSAELWAAIAPVAVPDDVAAAITSAAEALGPDVACAVRSSATAEDLPTASFAGQHDSFLDVTGAESVLRHVARCWASLFTERAIAYRASTGFEHHAVAMAVVVQQMVPADVSGVAFTAHPLTGDRRIVAIEAVAGLGEDLVAGLVDPDRYEVRDGELLTASLGVLTDQQVLELAALARRIEAHLGAPQDIEWCLADGELHVVQSRPITTLFPVPEVDDDEPHVYVSVGHQQMMTDPMKPLGLSVWQLTAARPMHVAAGRLFVDVAGALASPAGRATLEALGRSDPLIGSALRSIVDRGDVVLSREDLDPATAPPGLPGLGGPMTEADPDLVADLIAQRETSLAELAERIAPVSGPAVFDLIADDLEELKRGLFHAPSLGVIMAGMEASWWLDEHLGTWLGEKGAADVLSRSAPGNVTSEMGLALLDVADEIRPHPGVVAHLRAAHGDDGFLDGLDDLDGGPGAHRAIEGFLDTYGMRCIGEIDLTRPRWAERPSMLLPVLLGNVDNHEPGEGARRFERGRLEAEAKALDVLTRLRALPDGEAKAAETEAMIARVRTFIGYREFPKYALVRRYATYKQALLREITRLVADGVLREVDDAWFLTFAELHEAVRTGVVDRSLVDTRRAAFATYAALTPPRVMTGHGEVVTGTYGRDDAPAGALVGLAVSAGTVEGRARVVHDVAGADLLPGDILVTTHTDPSWSPVFASIAGLVTEVGGVMTHGAVVAREYGLPAVVGAVDATRRIRDGQRIRVHGTDGYVEILDG